VAGHDGGGLNMTVEGRRGQMADQVGHDVEMIAMTRPTVIAGLTGNLKCSAMTVKWLGMTKNRHLRADTCK